MLDRIFGVIMVLLATLLPPQVFSLVTYPEVQLILGTLIAVYIIAADAIAGMLMGVAVLIMYFQVYAHSFGISVYDLIKSSYSPSYHSTSLVSRYVSPEHLEKAQTNVVDPLHYDVEVKGVEGVYGEPVYGAQGITSNKEMLPGFDVEPEPGLSLA